MKKKDKVSKSPKKRRQNIIKEIFCVNDRFEFIGLLKNIGISVIGGILVAVLTKNSMSIYGQLKKSILTPPDIVFPIVWTVLYILMGISAYRIYMNNKAGKNDHEGYFYYLIQLLINFLWAIIFFNLRLYGVSSILILILLSLVIITTIKFFKTDKIAGVLMIPYTVWLIFASYLSAYIWIFNEM